MKLYFTLPMSRVAEGIILFIMHAAVLFALFGLVSFPKLPFYFLFDGRVYKLWSECSIPSIDF